MEAVSLNSEEEGSHFYLRPTEGVKTGHKCRQFNQETVYRLILIKVVQGYLGMLIHS